MSLKSPELPPSQQFSEAHLHARTYQKGDPTHSLKPKKVVQPHTLQKRLENEHELKPKIMDVWLTETTKSGFQ